MSDDRGRTGRAACAAALAMVALAAWSAPAGVEARAAGTADRPPDQIHVAWPQDSGSSFTVVWHTASTSSSSTIQWRVQGQTAWQQTTGALRRSGTTGTLHEATVSGLGPSTTYEYVVPGDGAAQSAVLHVQTAPAVGSGGSFDVVFVADTGLVGRLDGLANGTAQVVQEITQLSPQLVLGGGDFVSFDTDKRYGTLDNTIDAWFNQMQPIASFAPLMPTYGNHEGVPALGESYAAWAARFPTPAGGGSQSRNYAFDVGNAHFVSIFAVDGPPGPSKPLSATTMAWIESDIRAAQARGQRWIVPFMHVSAYTDGSNHPSNLAYRAQLGPLFERLHVPLVLTTHDQSYERTWPLADIPDVNRSTSTSLTCYGPSDGVTWMKVSPGGKRSNISRGFSAFVDAVAPSWTAVRDNTMFHYARLRFIDGTTLHAEAYGVRGDGSAPVLQDAVEYRANGCAAPPPPPPPTDTGPAPAPPEPPALAPPAAGASPPAVGAPALAPLAAAAQAPLAARQPGRVVIAGGARFTRSAVVRLDVHAPAETQSSEIRNAGGAWQRRAVLTRYTWRLSATGARGARAVEVRFIGSGLENLAPARDGIVLDTRAPRVLSTTLPSRVALASGAPVVLRIRASDDISGLAGVQVAGGRGPVVPWRAYTARLRLAHARGPLRVRVSDRAGSVSAWRAVRPG